MERLTGENNNNDLFHRIRTFVTHMAINKSTIIEHHNKLYDKLEEYEDLEEQNQLIKLPCKTGDIVWILNNKECSRCLGSSYSYKSDCMNCDSSIGFTTYIEAEFDLNMLKYIGKTIFISKTKAEEAIEKVNSREISEI